jgi:AcrR family transcriptional regulator
MPKVTEQHKDDRRRQIATAALRVFGRKGFQLASMADIIAESGLSAGAIYGHYKNKDELVHVAIGDLLSLRIADALDGSDGTTAHAPGDLVRIFTKSIEWETGDPGILLQVWAQAALEPAMQSVTTMVGEQLRTILENYLSHWYRSSLGFRAPAAEDAARAFAPLYVGIVQGYVVQRAIFSDFDADAYLAAASAIRPDFALVDAVEG